MNIRPVLALFTIAATLALGACSSTPTQEPVTIKDAAPAQAPGQTSAPQTATPGNVPTVTPPAADAFNPLREFSIFFDLDQYSVDDKQIALVRRHANYIKTNPAQRVSVQGNTDERGSREYNLSLGQKRAEAVKKLLLTEGAKETQIEAVSLGEEKPQDPGHHEAAWAKNRRSDITYPK